MGPGTSAWGPDGHGPLFDAPSLNSRLQVAATPGVAVPGRGAEGRAGQAAAGSVPADIAFLRPPSRSCYPKSHVACTPRCSARRLRSKALGNE